MAERFLGYLDGVAGHEAKGWAISRGNEDSIGIVDIFIDGKFEAQIWANELRGDLNEPTLRDGYAGFSYTIPDRFRDGATHTIDARHAGTQRSLEHSPKTFSFKSQVEARRQWCNRAVVFEHTLDASFRKDLAARRRLAVFATYHGFAHHLRYHRRLAESLVAAGYTVLIVHAADEHRHALIETGLDHCFTILKRNLGYDFGSYATGILCVGDAIRDLDELVLINDSVLQISPDLRDVLARCRTMDADVVGCTDSYERKYHLQSYLMWFGRSVCRSGALQRFMSGYTFTSVKDEVINEGEIGLSQSLQSQGFRLAAIYEYQAVAARWLETYAETEDAVHALPGDATGHALSFKTKILERLDHILSSVLGGTPVNPSHFFWDTLIVDFGCPLVKRELMILNPCFVPTYFRLSKVLSGEAALREEVFEMRRQFGGNLVPLVQRGAAVPIPLHGRSTGAGEVMSVPLRPRLEKSASAP